MKHRTEAELVAACLAGEARAWEALLERYGRLIWSVALRLGASHAEAEEVFQRTWVVLVERLDTLKRPEGLAAWIASVARHQTWQLFDEARRSGRVPAWEGEPPGDDRAAEPAETLLLEIERLELLGEAVARLDGRCRALLELLFLTEPRPAYREIAERCGIAVGSIGPIRARCLERLRKQMERLYQEGRETDSLEKGR